MRPLDPRSKPYIPGRYNISEKPNNVIPIIVPVGIHLLTPTSDPIYKTFTKSSPYGAIGLKI